MTAPAPVPAAAARSRRWPAVVVAVIALLVLLWAFAGRTGPVPQVRAVTPAPGAVLTAAPREVAIAFSGVPKPQQMHVTVLGPDGMDVATAAPRVDGSRVVAPIAVARTGLYRVAYHIELGPGQSVSDVDEFTVAAGTVLPPVAAPAGPAQAPPAGHVHLQRDPMSLTLTLIALFLVVVLVAVLVRRPRWR